MYVDHGMKRKRIMVSDLKQLWNAEIRKMKLL